MRGDDFPPHISFQSMTVARIANAEPTISGGAFSTLAALLAARSTILIPPMTRGNLRNIPFRWDMQKIPNTIKLYRGHL